MTQAEARKIADDRMGRERAAHLKGEDVAEDAALAGDMPVDPSLQCHDPRSERAEEPRTKERPKPIEADQLLETWYWYRTSGRLKSAKAMEQSDTAEGQDEAMLAALYVESTPGYSDDRLRPILLHKLDGKPWASWYGVPSRALASAIFDAFRLELAHRLKTEPFVVYATNARTPDHLEQADAANDPDLGDRNREWRERRNQKLTKTDAWAA